MPSNTPLCLAVLPWLQASPSHFLGFSIPRYIVAYNPVHLFAYSDYRGYPGPLAFASFEDAEIERLQTVYVTALDH